MSAENTNSNIPDSDAVHPRLPAVLTSEISRLYSAGFSLLPLGGPDGKKPIVQYRGRKRLTLSLLVDRMANAGSRTFGIRLKGLLVVDVDTDTPEAREYVERRFGASPVRVRTGRGFHLYFRFSGSKPKQIRLPGIAIDFKSGENEFVVGPESKRPDEIVYLSEGRLLSPESLPWFDDLDECSASEPEPAKRNGRYPQGVRHTMLKRCAHQFARGAASFADLLTNLRAFRDSEIERPEDFSDTRLESLALWFWNKREEGNLWGGTNSAVQIHRSIIDELARRGDGVAFLLYGIVCSAHGHKPDAQFAIVPDGLRASGRLNAGRRQIYAAIDLLVELSLLHRHVRMSGRRNHNLYRFGNAYVGKEGEGSTLILVSGKDTCRNQDNQELAA
ncbi:bifunctional DNA primase/polymerase [Mesorhizobium sp. AaZ16]|uniref:bifunctional DNA primase/polymerase n=1 Tax=Mesorhizobium sp. AaZ16 TaxID=3402289 RepID=UPI00374F4180